MRYIIIIYCLILSSATVFSQEEYYDPDDAKSIQLLEDSKKNTLEKKVNYHITTGAFVNSGSMQGSNYGTYIMPDIGYKVTNKLNIRAGLLLMNSNRFNIQEAKSYSASSFNSTFLFVRGDYQLSEKVLIHGAVFKDFNSLNSFESEGYAVGLEYRISKKSSIGVEFHFNKGNDPFYHRSPFNPYNSFSNNMFNY